MSNTDRLRSSLPWPACTEDDCPGKRLDEAGLCFAHATDDGRVQALERVTAGEALNFAVGVRFTEELLAELLAAVPRDDDQHKVLYQADFRLASLPHLDLDQAIFQGDARFDGARFEGDARFDTASFQGIARFLRARFYHHARFGSAIFRGDALFVRASFRDYAGFGEASFQGDARFDHASFQGDAGFDQASFQRRAGFERAIFRRDTHFDEAAFQGEAWFQNARFLGNASFDKARFQRDASFGGYGFESDARFIGATFQGEAGFVGTDFKRDALFNEASFERPLTDLIVVNGTLWLERIVLKHPLQLEVTAPAASFEGTRFSHGGHLRLDADVVSLKEAEIPVPLILSNDQLRFPDGRRLRDLASEETGLASEDPGPPRLLSVQRADVAGLAVTDVDLSSCRFAGAHHLDQLKITGTDTFWRVPPIWQVIIGRRAATGSPTRGRQVLAEERAWRHQTHPRRRRWQPSRQLADTLNVKDLSLSPHQPGPAELAGIYRQLRKGREDQKNEPGAADFYYGEMEMRRAALPRWSAERFLLDLYWLVSGYALRATRALATLTLLVMVVTGVFALWGLPAPTSPPSGSVIITGQPPNQRVTFTLLEAAAPQVPQVALAARVRDPDRVEQAFRSASSAVVFRDTGQQLTIPGRYTEMVARFLGPVLLALAILSVRNRVKR